MICAIAILDEAARERLAQLARLTERFGIPARNIHGHITLATYVGEHESRFVSSCKESLPAHEKFSVWYDRIEIWGPPEIIVAAPRKDHGIAAIQKEISRGWEQDLNEWTKADVWQPHTTLVTDPQADYPAIAEAMGDKFEPFSAMVDRIEFSRVYEQGYEIVDCVELMGEST